MGTTHSKDVTKRHVESPSLRGILALPSRWTPDLDPWTNHPGNDDFHRHRVIRDRRPESVRRPWTRTELGRDLDLEFLFPFVFHRPSARGCWTSLSTITEVKEFLVSSDSVRFYVGSLPGTPPDQIHHSGVNLGDTRVW